MTKTRIVRRRRKKRRRGFKGEFHFPGHNFTGPGTNLEARLARGDKPVDPTDEASMIHDIAYNNISKDLKAKRISKKEAYTRVRRADRRMLQKMFRDRHRSFGKGPGAVISNTAASIAMTGKVALEAMGIPITKWLKLI